jgi:tetratricopeptide (TPR) repeat protein
LGFISFEKYLFVEKIVLFGDWLLLSVNDIWDQLTKESEPDQIRRIVLQLVQAAQDYMDSIVEIAVQRIRIGDFDGNNWSTAAFSVLESYNWPEKPGLILKALVDHDPENGAYLNNFAIFLEVRGQLGDAIEYYARAYATDYKIHGHDKASTFPAWTNLHRIASGIKKG